MIKRQRFSSNRGSRCLFCLADNPTLLPAAPRFLSHASFIKEQVLLHDACFQPELRERVLPGKLVPDEPFDPDIHRHTAHTAIAEQTHAVCHLFAHIHPKKKIAALTDKEKENLFYQVKETMNDIYRQGGRNTESDLFGENGKYTACLSKDTAGKACPRCGETIVKENYLGGSIYYCRGCQILE